MNKNLKNTSILVVENAKSLNKIVKNELIHLGYICCSAFSLKNIQEKTEEKILNAIYDSVEDVVKSTMLEKL